MSSVSKEEAATAAPATAAAPQRAVAAAAAAASSSSKLSANFRSSYYEKVGFRGSDERKTLETLLNQDPINVDKLSNFALKCSSIPTSQRLHVWKLVLGILNKYKSNREFCWSWKLRAYEDCYRAVEGALLPGGGGSSGDTGINHSPLRTNHLYNQSPGGGAPAAAVTRPTTLDRLTFMWLVVTGRLAMPAPTSSVTATLSLMAGDIQCQNFQSILSYVATLSPLSSRSGGGGGVVATPLSPRSGGVVEPSPEAFFIARNLYEILDVSDEVIRDNYAFYLKALSYHKEVYSVCGRIGLNEVLPFAKWISRGFTGVFVSHHLAKILDKVVSGSVKILAYLALVVVENGFRQIYDSENAYEALARITDFESANRQSQRFGPGQQHLPGNSNSFGSSREEIESRLIQAAIDRWARDGHQLSAGGSGGSLLHNSKKARANQHAIGGNLPHYLAAIGANGGASPYFGGEMQPIHAPSFMLNEIKIPDDLIDEDAQ